MGFELNQRVMARDAFGELRPAVICPIPREWRDASQSEVVTTKGKFDKVWLKFRSPKAPSIPWPLEDVFDADDKELLRLVREETAIDNAHAGGHQ